MGLSALEFDAHMFAAADINDAVSQELLTPVHEVSDWHARIVIIVAIVLAVLVLGGIVLLLRTSIRYRIGEKSLRITLLGVPVRRLRLDNIRQIHTQPRPSTEKWHNTVLLRPGRCLVLDKRRGLFKHLLISPEKPQVFRMQLHEAILRNRRPTPTPALEPAVSD
jgi:hypothetical protein